jgi:hypothetical protein
MNLALPFIGRKGEAARLRRLHARRKHVLIFGAAGIGKSALVAQLSAALPLIVCPKSATLGEICSCLEAEFHLTAPNFPLVQRKNRLLETLAATRQTAVFDDVGRTTPKISSFLESAMERAPIWICARSELARDIGHFWPLLARCEKIELRPFRFSETNALLAASIESGQVPPSVKPFARQLHQLTGGLPLALRELLEQFAVGHYDLSHRAGLQLLELDRRINRLAAIRSADSHVRGIPNPCSRGQGCPRSES